MQRKDKVILKKEIFIKAPIEVVFESFKDPNEYVKWMGKTVSIDFNHGGVFQIDPNGVDLMLGKFIEIIENQRIVFSWGWKGSIEIPPESTLVEINFLKKDAGTLVELTHSSLSQITKDRHSHGWDHYLSRLKNLAQGSIPGPDPFAIASVRHG